MMDIPEVAERLAVSVMTVRRLLKSGELPHFRVGRQYRIQDDDLKIYIIEHSNSKGNQDEQRKQ